MTDPIAFLRDVRQNLGLPKFGKTRLGEFPDEGGLLCYSMIDTPVANLIAGLTLAQDVQLKKIQIGEIKRFAALFDWNRDVLNSFGPYSRNLELELDLDGVEIDYLDFAQTAGRLTLASRVHVQKFPKIYGDIKTDDFRPYAHRLMEILAGKSRWHDPGIYFADLKAAYEIMIKGDSALEKIVGAPSGLALGVVNYGAIIKGVDLICAQLSSAGYDSRTAVQRVVNYILHESSKDPGEATKILDELRSI